jgi:hypothetical protein
MFPCRGGFLGKPLRAISRFRHQDAQTPPSPTRGEGGRGMRGKRRGNAANRASLSRTPPLRGGCSPPFVRIRHICVERNNYSKTMMPSLHSIRLNERRGEKQPLLDPRLAPPTPRHEHAPWIRRIRPCSVPFDMPLRSRSTSPRHANTTRSTTIATKRIAR